MGSKFIDSKNVFIAVPAKKKKLEVYYSIHCDRSFLYQPVNGWHCNSVR